jgi:hypothetical protein
VQVLWQRHQHQQEHHLAALSFCCQEYKTAFTDDPRFTKHSTRKKIPKKGAGFDRAARIKNLKIYDRPVPIAPADAGSMVPGASSGAVQSA